MDFVIDKGFVSCHERSDRVLECAEAFGLGLEAKKFKVYDNLNLSVNQGDTVYICGQSGSGKSLLLRELSSQMSAGGLSVADIHDVELPEEPLIDQVGKNTNEAIEILGYAGINDAYLFLRKPSELSDGQRYRMRVAKLIESKSQVWVCDEFGAILDRTTAKVISFNLRKTAKRYGATVIVATTHTDLIEALQPDLLVFKSYGTHVEVTHAGQE